jgi:hypothetical protein
MPSDPGPVQSSETSSGAAHPTLTDSRISPVGSVFLKAFNVALSVDGYVRNFGFRNSAGAVVTFGVNCLWIADVYALKSLTSMPNMMFVGDVMIVCRTADVMAYADHFMQPKERMWVDTTMYQILRATDRHGITTFALENVRS